MLRNYTLIAALVLLPGSVMALGIAVDGGDPPASPFVISTQLGDVQPTGSNCDALTGDCTYVFNNDTGAIITSLSFSMDINPGLGGSTQTSLRKFIRDNFQCTQDSFGGYFLHCNVTYDQPTGLLTYSLYGVRRPEGDELCPTKDCELGEHEGIPPAVPGYDQFRIVLTGWVEDAPITTDGNLYDGTPPTFTNSFTATPEPSTVLFSGIGLVLLAGFGELRRRKTAALKRF